MIAAFRFMRRSLAQDPRRTARAFLLLALLTLAEAAALIAVLAGLLRLRASPAAQGVAR